MTYALLALLLASPAAADPAAMSATLEAIRSQAVLDPAAPTTREDAAQKSGKSFDQSFTIQTLTPVEFVSLDGAPRKTPAPETPETPAPPRKPAAPPAEVKAPGESDGSNADY